MAKKRQFIRHLEFYGFPDQNGYSSEVNGMSVDLSEIIEKNKEQDEEIQGLEGEKADKKDLDELSGTVETLISAQTEFNNEVVSILSGVTNDISTLKEIDNMFGEQLSAITDGLNDAISNIQELNDEVDGISNNLESLSGKVESFSGETNDKFSEVWEELDKKLDKTEAEEIYAKKDEIVTKEELEQELEDYTTKEYIDSLGHITQEQGDARYAKIETVDALSNRLNSAVTDLNTKIYEVSGDVQTLSTTTNARIGTLETNFETLRGETNRKLNEMSGVVASHDTRINKNSDDIDALEDEMARKANKSEVEALENTVSNLADKVATKVGQAEFEEYKGLVNNKFNNMNETKADKSEITRLDTKIDDVDNKLDQEILDRISGDTLLQNQIDTFNNQIVELKEKDVEHTNKIQGLEDDLAQEILDRQKGDLDIIGKPTDIKDDNTIYGAKAYAKDMKRQAVESANLYTDGKIRELSSEYDQKFEDVERELTGKASKEYVDNSRNELKTELLNTIENDIDTEKNERVAEDVALWNAVRANTRAISGNTYQIDHNSNRINTITAWDGVDPAYYDNSGNGILDVLHREFHEFEDSYGAIKDIKVVDGNLVIVFYTRGGGTKEAVIPLSEIIDLDNYYTKEETDAKIAEAIAQIDLSNYYTKEETDEKVAEVDAKAEENKTNIASLFDKLGYTDNNTLITTNQHEVAFGEYNVSNTSTEPSGQTIFAIGNGTDGDNRSNALEVRKNGDVYMWVEGEYMQINRLLGMLAHEVYDENTNNG